MINPEHADNQNISFPFAIKLLLKVALQILGRKFYKNTKKIILTLPKPFNFHSYNSSSRKPSDNKRKLRIPAAQVDIGWNHGLFLHEQLAHLHTGNKQKRASKIAFDEDIIENNYMFVVLWNLNVICHLVFPQCCFLFLAQNLKITQEAT